MILSKNADKGSKNNLTLPTNLLFVRIVVGNC